MSYMNRQLDEIVKLSDLKEKGIITESEFETQKKRLLGENNPVVQTYVSSPVTLMESYRLFWKKSFVLTGRACMSEYWYPVLVNFLIFLVLNFLTNFSGFFDVCLAIFSIALIAPAVAVWVRRIHDTGHSAKFLLVPFIFIITMIALSLIFSIITAMGGNVMNIRSVIFVVMGFTGVFVFFGFGVAGLVFALMPTELKENKYGKPYVR